MNKFKILPLFIVVVYSSAPAEIRSFSGEKNASSRQICLELYHSPQCHQTHSVKSIAPFSSRASVFIVLNVGRPRLLSSLKRTFIQANHNAATSFQESIQYHLHPLSKFIKKVFSATKLTHPRFLSGSYGSKDLL
jgi:hypothetical protein